MIEIIPSPGTEDKNFDSIQYKVRLVIGLVDWVEIDILDNTLYQNATYNNWESFRAFKDEIHLAGHLMVSDPAKYVGPLVINGFKRLIADVEGDTVRDFTKKCRERGVEAGVALNGPASLELVEPYVDEIDTVLLMTINAGFSGQLFLPAVLPKIKALKELYPHMPIEVDGGIDKQTAPQVFANGATRLVSTSYLYQKNSRRIAEAIAELKGV